MSVITKECGDGFEAVICAKSAMNTCLNISWSVKIACFELASAADAIDCENVEALIADELFKQ